MDKNRWLKVGGVVATVAGVIALALSGSSQAQVVDVVGVVFLGIGVIAAIFKKE